MRIILFTLLTFCLFCNTEPTIDINLIQAGDPNEVYGSTQIKAKGSLTENYKISPLNFGITPWDTPAKLKRMFAPVISYLSAKLKKRIRFVVSQDYATLKKDLEKGIIHIAAFTPGAYADALEQVPDKMIYVATAQENYKDYYRGYIVTSINSSIKSLSGLKGKTFAFVEKGSSSGYKYPLALLIKNKIIPNKAFKKVYFLGTHINVTNAIIDKKVDAGATWDGHLENVEKKVGKAFRILKKTPRIPYDAIVVSIRKPKLAKSLAELLTSITPETKTKQGQLVLDKAKGLPYSGWTIRSPKMYRIVRETTKMIKRYE